MLCSLSFKYEGITANVVICLLYYEVYFSLYAFHFIIPGCAITLAKFREPDTFKS